MQGLARLIYILFIACILIAQENSIEQLRQKYISFNYDEVIKLADEMIISGEYSSEQLVEIYQLKGMAQYSIGKEIPARSSFEELLKLDSNFSMDPNRVSPKIVSFFNDIKVAYQSELEQERPILDSLRIVRQSMMLANENYKNAVVKNLVLPGWGQFQMGNTVKGLVYSILGAASTATAIAYIIKTNDKESAYLNETDKSLIGAKYDEFNSAYKTRNLLITAAAAVWVISQIDILFFTDITPMSPNGNASRFSPPSEVQFSFSIPLN